MNTIESRWQEYQKILLGKGVSEKRLMVLKELFYLGAQAVYIVTDEHMKSSCGDFTQAVSKSIETRKEIDSFIGKRFEERSGGDPEKSKAKDKVFFFHDEPFSEN